VGIEHHPHPNTALAGTEERLLDLLTLQLELFEQQFLAGLIKQLHHRGAAVVGHHKQTLLTAKGGDHDSDLDVGLF
jgi:hypothetical protein